jgi:hypothetical protein
MVKGRTEVPEGMSATLEETRVQISIEKVEGQVDIWPDRRNSFRRNK